MSNELQVVPTSPSPETPKQGGAQQAAARPAAADGMAPATILDLGRGRSPGGRPGGERLEGAAAYAAVSRLVPGGQATATRLLADLPAPQGASGARSPTKPGGLPGGGKGFADADQARAVAQENYAQLTSALNEVNRAMTTLSTASIERSLTAAGGEAALRALAGSLRDANTKVEIAIRRLRDAFQVSGTVTVRRKDGTLELGSFSLAFAVGPETGTLHSPGASERDDLPEDSEELTGESGYAPGSRLDMRI